MKIITRARILMCIAWVLSVVIALMFWNEIEYDFFMMIFALPMGLYFPIVIFLLFIKTFKREKHG